MGHKGKVLSCVTASRGATAAGEQLGRGQVTEIQRARILAAMAEVASERGVINATVAGVVDRAGVSRRTFYEIFNDCEDCFMATLDEGVTHASSRMRSAYESAGRWRERIRSSLLALLGYLDEQGPMGRILVVESLAAGPRSLQRRSRVLAQLVAVVDSGRSEAKLEVSPLAAEGVVGAVFSVIHGRMIENDGRPLTELVSPLMGVIALPYLGPKAARKELKLDFIAEGARATAPLCNPLKDLEMRLTYRTVRVLLAVVASPGASNRVVGEASGIADQGQASKLLARLEKLGLIENRGGTPARGEANAWMLTERGEELHHAIAASTSAA